jgi:Carboxypeptidase regulatory-like domain
MLRFLGKLYYVLLLTSAALSVLCLPAQTGRSSIQGVVLDPSGAAVPGVTVTVTETRTGRTAAGQAGPDGVYLVPDLLPGEYSVAAQAKGFRKTVISGLTLDMGFVLTQGVRLQVAATETEQVLVAGSSSLIETATNTVGATVDMTHVLELPFSDRFVFGLVNLVPASYFKTYSDDPSTTRLTQVSLGGGRYLQTLALIDGVDNTRGDGMGPQTVEMEPPPDVIREFRVEVNNLSAEYGRTGGGVVNATIKSGTNQFHGGLYELLRNDVFDAAGWGNTRKPSLRRNTAGVNAGGPIRHNRTFFFAAFERLWNNQGSTATANLGLPAWRKGDFSTATRDANGSAFVVPIYDPASGNTTTFPGNVIPSNRLDPVAVKALQYMPLPNQSPNDPFNNTGNWQSYPVATYRRNYYVGRVDHEINPSTRIFARYMWTPDRAIQAGGSGGDPAWGPASGQQNNPTSTQNVAFNLSRVLTPNLFLNFTAGLSRLSVKTGNVDDPNVNYPKQLGMPNVPGPQFPQFNFGGGLVPVDNFGNAPDRVQKGLYSNYLGNFTRVAGDHALKFGIAYNRFNNNNYVFNTAAGQWVFNGSYTQGIGANGLGLANTGVNLADFLLGLYTSASISLTPTFGRRAQGYAGYLQDDWKVTPRLTLNLGLRYETQTPAYSPTNAFQSFNPYLPNPLAGTNGIPAGALGITTFENRNGQGKYLYDWDYKHGFMPRFGFAYRLSRDNDTVVRGGFGLFYTGQTPQGTYLNGTLGFGEVYSASYAAIRNPSPVLSAGIPDGALALPPLSELTPSFGDAGTRFAQSSISFYDPYLALPYTLNFNLSVQHQWKGILIETGYLANLGRHLSGTSRNLNVVRPELLPQTAIPVQLRRPFTVLTGSNSTVTTYEDNNGLSNYHAFTLKLERRLKAGVGWTLAYTWSKWIDNINFESVSNVNLGDNNGPQNLYNRAGERSLAQNDIPHRLVFSPVIELPMGRGKRWLSNGRTASLLAGGWELAMLATLQSGSPFGPTVLNGGANILGDPSQTLRPNLIGDPRSPNQWQPAVGVRGIQYLNPAAFAVPAAFTYGSQSRTLPNILGPGVRQFNVMFSKNFYRGESFRFQLRADILDLLNTPQFTLPATSLGGSNFGIITAADNSTRRIVELGAKIYF